jgi:hypothetical protein
MSIDDAPDDLLPANRAATLARCHVNSVRRWEWDGQIRGWTVKGQLHVSLAEVLARAGPRRRSPRKKEGRLDAAVERAVSERWVKEMRKVVGL